MSAGVERQLVLDLAREPCFDRDDFLVSSANEAAAAAVRSWVNWPSRMLLLVGPPGSGKSHLAAIWAAETGALSLRGPSPVDAVGPGVGCFVLEDCDRAGFEEAPFFHTLNLVREGGGWLLMTARREPRNWNLATADLLSRLRLATVATMQQPDAALMKSVLIKLFTDRQILVDIDVVDYAARHCDQSLEAVADFVAAVDERALEAHRRVTRPLAARTLSVLRRDA